MSDTFTRHPRPSQLKQPRGKPQRARAREGSIVHCPGSKPPVKTPATLDEAIDLLVKVQRWHFARGWADIGYHFAVWRNHVFELRDRDATGAHCIGKNATHYGVLVLHPANEDADPLTLMTLDRLLNDIGGEALPHRDFARKACPGDSITTFLRERAAIRLAWERLGKAERATGDQRREADRIVESWDKDKA